MDLFKKVYEITLSYDNIPFANIKEKNMAKNKGRESIILKCTVCGEETYLSSSNKKKHPDRLERNKYCPRCQKVTVHKEKKK